jgi:predicted AlkP superfamily pyrophosphatase or phosphodiesterase
MQRWRRVAILVALALLPRQTTLAAPPPILLLVSIDGWRWDYLTRYPAPNLRALAARGVRAARMIPSTPVLTFPNHYTIVTGRYPEHHGIVANNMNDAAIERRFSMSADTAKDPRWWSAAEPLWVSVVKRGGRAATMFWPGTEVEIRGVRPTYWVPFAKAITTYDRVRQALQWLALPEAARPEFVSLYFDEVDTAGHDFGIGSRELAAAAARVDDALGELAAGVHALGLDDRATVVVVSDHGMANIAPGHIVYLDDYVDPDQVDVTEWHGLLAIAPRSGSAADVDRLYGQLHGKHPALAVYRREQVPERLHYRDNPRIAPIVGMLQTGWAITMRTRPRAMSIDAATHGFDPTATEMGALFIASGPAVRRGVVLPPFPNVDVYDMLCGVLGLAPQPNDGNPATARRILAPGSASTSPTRPPPPLHH